MSGAGSAATATGLRTLELGCGFAKTPGAFGVDILPGSNADLIHNLDVFPYPLADNGFDCIICRDVLEHVSDFVRTMEEIWRVGRPGAEVEISGPFMSSVNYFSDPTHKRAFTSRSFDYFIPGRPAQRFNYSPARFDMLSCDYDIDQFPHRQGWRGWAFRWANRNKEHYENRFAFIYPVYNIYFRLRVIK
jgi:SAM-dependent methyltransferase